MASEPRGYAFDAGGLGALDGRDESARRVARVIAHALRNDLLLVIPASALAQVLFDAARQTRLSRLLKQLYVIDAPLDRRVATAIGPRRHKLRHDDVVDVHVAWVAEIYDLAIVTSDADDMRKLGIPNDRLVEV